MNRFRLLVAVMAACMACAGCSGVPSLPTQMQVTGDFTAPQTPYGSSLTGHTRGVELYDRLETVAKAWATWKSDAFRTVYAEEIIRAYHIVDSEAQILLEEACSGPIEFHVAIYTPEFDRRDLEADDAMWRAYLMDLQGGDHVPSSSVVEEKVTEQAKVMYPYISTWTRQFTITFDRYAGGDMTPPVMELAGPLGTLTFDFRTSNVAVESEAQTPGEPHE